MADDPGWRNGVQTLALILHTAAELQRTEEMQDVTDALTTLLNGMAANVAANMGVEITDDQADGIGSALLADALTYIEKLPFAEVGNPS